MRYTKRTYHDRPPREGDRVVVIKNVGGYHAGDELVVVDVKSFTGDCIKAYNPRSYSYECIRYIHDNWYRIFTDITYVKTGEQHIVKRFLGIPFYRKTIDIYEEELTHD